MRRGLFIIQAPLQVLEAYEAINIFSIKNPHILVRYSGNKNNDFQIQFLIKLLNLEEFVLDSFKLIGDPNNRVKYSLQFVHFLFKFLKERYDKSPYEYIFLPEYYSGFSRTIYNLFFRKEKDIFFMDDGVATLYTQRKLFSKDFSKNLFTFFDSLEAYPNQILKKHNFENLKKFIFSKNINIPKKEEVVFIGQAFYESKIMSIENNVRLVKQVSELFKDKNIVYIPHRRESELKLYKINNIENVSIKKIFYPIELFTYFECYIPSKFVSFVSTALFTLNKLYDSNIIALNFNYNNYGRKENMKLTYEELKKINIKVLDIE